jgi:hypothetical protein
MMMRWNTKRAKNVASAGLAAALCAAGCASTIDQHKNSGPDYRPDGAALIELEDGEGAAVDIVTYPGGDRVDWKKVELPEDFAGVLQVRLLFQPPRDGLEISFEVYDERFERVAVADPPPGSGARVLEAEVKPAFGGTYYFHVFAPRRTDAAEYMLAVRKQRQDVSALLDDDVGALPRIPDPPTLPAIVEGGGQQVAQQGGGGQEQPHGGGGQGQPQGGGGSPPPPDPIQDDDRTPALEPIRARVVTYQLGSDGAVILTVNRGTNDGVERGWTGQMMMGNSGRPLRGGTFTVTRVTSGEAVGQARVSVDQIRANRDVVLMPPGYEAN